VKLGSWAACAIVPIKLSLHIISGGTCSEDIWERGSNAVPSLISALDVGEWSASWGQFIMGKEPLVPTV
jgi:hypothetical protein